ncbi:MAG: hypothetical protein IT427_16840 [Pirellulales bacterium]|nr:hypothetical protein [Pirellulales bacterium]
MALVQSNESVSDNDLYSKAGLNTMLAWKDRPAVFDAAARQGIPWHFQLDPRRGPLSEELKSYVSKLFETHPGAEGCLVWDEPKLPEMAELGKVVAWIKETHPQLLVYTSGNPITPTDDPRYHAHLAGITDEHLKKSSPYSYNDYLRDIIERVGPDVLMADVYPFWNPEKIVPEDYLVKRYYLMLATIRQEAIKANLPFWIFVQAYEHPNRCRFPSEADVRMQVYSSLAFGFTGLAYFTYDPMFERSILDRQHRPTELYEHIAKLNAEVGHLGKSLRCLTSTEVVYFPGRQMIHGKTISNPFPAGMKRLSSSPFGRSIVSNLLIPESALLKNAMIGFFKDDLGGRYFMVVNLTHGANRSSLETTMPLTITFPPTIKTIAKLSRETGESEFVAIQKNRLELTLAGGTGELFKIGDANFAGLDESEAGAGQSTR